MEHDVTVLEYLEHVNVGMLITTLKEIRKNKIGLTMEGLAEEIDVEIKSIYRWENGSLISPKVVRYILEIEKYSGQSILELIQENSNR